MLKKNIKINKRIFVTFILITLFSTMGISSTSLGNPSPRPDTELNPTIFTIYNKKRLI